jgi:serine protease Do
MKLSIGKILISVTAVALALLAVPPSRLAAMPQDPDIRIKVAPRIVLADDSQDIVCDLDQLRDCIHEKIAKKLAQSELKIALAQKKTTDLLAKREAELQTRLSQQLSSLHSHRARIEAQLHDHLARLQERTSGFTWFSDDSEGGWLGVQISEVSAEKAKELRLAFERGVVITDVEADSPAAKAGFKSNDVITEMNGQRIEGTAQFRRLIRETPSGRTVQFTVWREGRSQQISAPLGKWSDRWQRDVRVISPRDFDFQMEMPRVFTMTARQPRLGISGDDISGQLGNYFGAPDGEGILIREVTSASPAEKAGLKAGDVIIKLDGERVRNLNDLRERLRDKREKKTVAVSVLRKGAESTFNVEIEQPKPPERRTISRRVTT